MGFRATLLLVLLALSSARPAAGAAGGERTPCADDVCSRLRFIEDRLEADRDHGRLWQRGWPALYAVGVVWATTQAVETDDPATRADQSIAAVLSVGGIVDLLVPNFTHAQEGADDLRGLPEDTPAARRRKLARAEALLRRNAAESARRYDWLRHVMTVAVPVAAGLFVGFSYDDWERAAVSTSLAIAVGEATIWTQPWAAADDLAEYERRFPDAAEGADEGGGGAPPGGAPSGAGAPTWRLLPTPGGAWLLVEF